MDTTLLTPTPERGKIPLDVSLSERNLILRLRSLRDKPRIVWLEVTAATLDIIAMQDLKRERLGNNEVEMFGRET
jgi:ABC-type molybdenum transport system ATPase subunit/photorepair protein PhrA